jgi:hypothetical protein
MTLRIGDTSVARPLVGLAILLLATGAAWGNPAPMKLLMVHVQPAGGEFCHGMPIQSCDQIVYDTPLTGTLDFDLILHWTAWDDPPDCDGLSVTVRWPDDWGFASVEVCGNHGGSFEPLDHGGIVRLPTLQGVPLGTNQCGIARITLDAVSAGRFEITEGSYDSGCMEGSCGASVGRVCGTCLSVDPCTHHGREMPQMDPEEIELQAAAGDSTIGSIVFHSNCDCYVPDISVTTDEPWMNLDVVMTHEIEDYGPKSAITVTAHAEGLAPGVHEGWIEGRRPDCSTCARVLFTVIEEDPPAAQPETWGSLKNRFRESTSGSVRP